MRPREDHGDEKATEASRYSERAHVHAVLAQQQADEVALHSHRLEGSARAAQARMEQIRDQPDRPS